MALPSFLAERDGAVVVAVRVRPRGGRDAIEGEREGALVVRVAAAPVGDAANRAVCRLVAKAAGTAPSRAAVVRGRRGRDKLVRLEGVSASDAAERLCG